MFDLAHNTYHDNALQQKYVANKLFNFINNNIKLPENIIDIGCGTGFLGEKFLEINKKVCFSDISLQMINECKKRFLNYPNADFKLLNFDDYEALKKNLSTETLVISNMSLQWAKNFFKSCNNIIENSSAFAFSIPIKGSLNEWYQLLRQYNISFNGFNFIDPQEVFSFFENRNIKYEVLDTSLKFSNITQLVKNFRNTGVNCKLLTNSKNIKKLLKYRNPVNCNYKVLNCIISI